MLDTYAIGPCRDFIADAADEPADGNEYGSEGDFLADVAVEPADGNQIAPRKMDADMELVRCTTDAGLVELG